MSEVVILTLGDGAGGCCGDGGCGTRTPVLHCQDALREAGADVTLVTASSDAEIDATFEGGKRLIVAVSTDGELRAVLRRLVKRYAPPPGQRTAELATDRTVPDLPPVGVLPLDASPLVELLGLPKDPAEVAAAVVRGTTRRLDLLRTDAGSVTVNGALLGTADAAGRAVPWQGRVEVDDVILSSGDEPILAATVANAAGYATFDGLALSPGAVPDDGLLDVAIAVPVTEKGLFRKPKQRIEVRRARGRAVGVTPRDGKLPYLDDGVAGEIPKRRNWWMERAAWAVYV
ncbi:diacylglycerol kinase family protein [Longispora albida]|uniref:diacylglycerol kinase family protein n=1 Tax=Longispora albida TaxID=203523 RepID=UPI000374CA7A|nr:diacylglycerol kinase family protein [Longispora albida]